MKRKIPKHVRRVLYEAKERLKKAYGAKLKRIVLYGSYARGDFGRGSDIDLIVLLKGMRSTCREILRCSKALGEMELEHDVLISIIPMDANEFRNRKLPLILNAKSEGVAV